MPKGFTAGFDIVAELSEKFCEDIFQMAYHTGTIPDYLKREFNDNIKTEVFMRPPDLKFIVGGETPNLCEISFDFVGRDYPKGEDDAELTEVTGNVKVSMMMLFTSDNEGNRAVAVNFAGQDAINYEFNSPEGTVFNLEETKERIKLLINTSFAQTLQNIPISPLINSDIGFCTFRSYIHNTDEDADKQNRFLAIFVINKSGFPAELPIPNNIYPALDFLTPLENNPSPKILISSESVNAAIDKQINAMKFPMVSETDSSIIIKSLNMQLHLLHRLIAWGKAKKVVKGFFDPKISFNLSLGIYFKNGVVELDIIESDVDVPWGWSLLNFLIPGVAEILIHVFEKMAKNGMGKNIGNMAGNAFPTDIFTSKQLPNSYGTVELIPHGSAGFLPLGMTIPIKSALLFSETRKRSPNYIYGHIYNKEFHRAECIYCQRMAKSHQKVFLSPHYALLEGYNGCAWCFPKYNTG